jgi:hypothetical protein
VLAGLLGLLKGDGLALLRKSALVEGNETLVAEVLGGVAARLGDLQTPSRVARVDMNTPK